MLLALHEAKTSTTTPYRPYSQNRAKQDPKKVWLGVLRAPCWRAEVAPEVAACKKSFIAAITVPLATSVARTSFFAMAASFSKKPRTAFLRPRIIPRQTKEPSTFSNRSYLVSTGRNPNRLWLILKIGQLFYFREGDPSPPLSLSSPVFFNSIFRRTVRVLFYQGVLNAIS
jgi:hypothetical protein